MTQWWKNPVLQGEDNDYGDYDYLINSLPKDFSYVSKYPQKCESCGKYHRFCRVSIHYFYTLDGYDSMDYTECPWCRLNTFKIHLKRKIHNFYESRRCHFFGVTKLGRTISTIVFRWCMRHKDSQYYKPLTNRLINFVVPF